MMSHISPAYSVSRRRHSGRHSHELRDVPATDQAIRGSHAARGRDQAGDCYEPRSARKERNERCILISQCLQLA